MARNLGIVKVGDEWECRCRYDDRELPAECGFQWDKGRRSWFTRERHKVGTLRSSAELAGFRVHFAILPDLSVPSWKGHPSLAKTGPDFPVPPGLDYYPYQKGGIAYALERKHTLIADSPGLGKSCQAIGVMNASPVKNALILCPAAIKHQWANFVDCWLNYYLSIGVYEKGRWPKTSVVIVNYDVLGSNHENLQSKEWDIVIADEIHLAKRSSNKRTMAVFGGGPDRLPPLRCKRFLALTGTPVDNQPIDLYPVLHYMLPDLFPSWWAFTLLYCNGRFRKFDYLCNGASNMKVLGAILREKVMVRRLTRHVQKQLPDCRREIIDLEAGDAAKKAARDELRAYEAATSEAFELREAGDSFGASMSQLKALESISKARMKTVMAKVPAAVEVMKLWAESEKLVVVCYHRTVIEAIRVAFGDQCVTYHGGTRDREAVKRAFIEDESIRLFVMQVTAGGTGVDGLQRVCRHGCVVEFDWRATVMDQAEARLWRVGQGHHVLWSYFVLPDSVDRMFLNANGQKAWTAASILDEPAHEAEEEVMAPKPGYLL